MTKIEFCKVVAYITAATEKKLSADALDVYFDCLGDLDYEIFSISAKRVLMAHVWATFPSIAELRQAAADTKRGNVQELSASEAWKMAWDAVAKIDPEIKGDFDKATNKLPAIVVETMKTYGITSLCYGKEPVGVVRGQFIKIYEQLAARENRLALFPEKLKTAIGAVGNSTPILEGVKS